jgi:hypothetical protein
MVNIPRQFTDLINLREVADKSYIMNCPVSNKTRKRYSENERSVFAISAIFHLMYKMAVKTRQKSRR